MIGKTIQISSFTAATPKGYEPRSQSVDDTRRVAIQQGGTVELTHDARDAARGAQVLYTDVWTSMGQEAEAEQRRRAFEGFTDDDDLMAAAGSKAAFLHCLPAHRGEEITAGVLDGPHSAVLDEAENRMHVQKALLEKLILAT